MLENLINLVRQNAGDALISNKALPNEKNEAAVAAAGNSIMDTLKNALTGGNIGEVFSFFKKGQQGAPGLVQKATDNYAAELRDKLGLKPAEARKTATNLIPKTMGQLAAKSVDPADSSFNVQEIFNKLSGNKTAGLNVQGLMNKFGSGKLDLDGDGDVDLQDLKKIFSGGSGIVEKVKGVFS